MSVMYKVDFSTALRKEVADKSAEELRTFIFELAEILSESSYEKVLSFFEKKPKKSDTALKADTSAEIVKISAEIDEILLEIEDDLYTFQWNYVNTKKRSIRTLRS